MAKFVATCGWILSSNEKLGRVAGNLADYIPKDDLPADARVAVETAQDHINKAILSLQDASRALIEADAEELSRKEGRQ